MKNRKLFFKRTRLFSVAVIVLLLIMGMMTACKDSDNNDSDDTPSEEVDISETGKGTTQGNLSQISDKVTYSISAKKNAIMTAHTAEAAKAALTVNSIDAKGKVTATDDFTVELGAISADKQSIELIVRSGDKTERLSVAYAGPIGIEAKYADAAQAGVLVYAVYADGRREELSDEEISVTYDKQTEGETYYFASFQGFTVSTKVNVIDGEIHPIHHDPDVNVGEPFSLVINLAGGINIDETTGGFDLKLVVNITEKGDLEMMLIDGDNHVLASYKGGKVNLAGFGMDVGFYRDAIETTLTDVFGEEAPALIDTILTYIKTELSEKDYNAYARVVLGLLLIPSGFNTTGFQMYAQNGEYIFNINCQTIIDLLTNALSDSFDEMIASLPFELDIAKLLGVERNGMPDLVLLINAIDDKCFGGELMNFGVESNVKMTLAESGLIGSIAFVNARDRAQKYLYLELGASTADEITMEVPEITESYDIQLDIPIVLPQKELYMTAHVTLHTADMLAEHAKNFISATVDVNDVDDAITFVLNDGYIYVDINELVSINSPESERNYTYVFPILDDDSTLLDELPSLIKNMFDHDDEEDDDDESNISDDNNINNQEADDGEEDEDFDPAVLLTLVRFEIDLDQDAGDLAKYIVANLSDIYSQNADILEKALYVKVVENGGDIILCISDTSLTEEGDLLSFINKFIGIPGEEGFTDINGNTLYDLLRDELGQEELEKINVDMEILLGFDLEDLFTKLYFIFAGLEEDAGFRIRFALSSTDNDDEVFKDGYIAIGLSCQVVTKDASNDIVITEEQIAAASTDIDELSDILTECFAGLLGIAIQ